MPRLPVDGTRVKELRVTLGSYERQQLERFIDGMQIKNIGTGVGAATDPIEALFGTTVGASGGLFIAAWALKRFFNVDVPIPTDLEDILALGASAYAAISASQYHSDRANIGGDQVDRDYAFWGRDRLKEFTSQLRRIGRNRKLKIGTFYTGDYE